MASQTDLHPWIREIPKVENGHLQKFRLYETRSNFYMIGRNKNRSVWRVLKIVRLEAFELNIVEDSTVYTEIECCDLLKRIHEGNKSTGGLKFVTVCYGIVGFVKFLGPHYMLLITKRRKIGVICGHAVYAITKSAILPIPNSTSAHSVAYSKNENRYKKLLCSVDLTKDFFFSYSYHVMHSFQKNLSSHGSGQGAHDTMFVWNEFLTTAIHNQLKNNLWTVALVYGFFKQVKLLISEKDFKLTLIARRSRHYAGTRYLKRGVNEKGCVANDVETEQIVFEDVPEGCPVQISSIVQNRGSIPLFWSQETSRLNMKPDIVLSKEDHNYEATRLHFQNLFMRYGNPIIILNLVKTREKKPRESLLRVEFANAIESINKDLPEESRLKFLHWDLNKYSRNRSTNVLALLGKVATYALNLTGFFYCQVNPISKSEELLERSEDEGGNHCCSQKHGTETSDADGLNNVVSHDSSNANRKVRMKPPKYQTGVLRTNCIDCLDRTNVAQYAYGWAALGHQLHALGYIDSPAIELDSPLADDLMGVYEKMGDTLALQYGGSAAHNKIFSQRRGQWKAATQSQEFFRTLQRYYSNAYMDAEKQDAINVFLGHYQPQLGKPALWELDSDQHYNVGSRGSNLFQENTRRPFKRSLSDGLCEASSVIEPEKAQDSRKGLSESSPEISTCESDSSYPRYTASMSRRQLLLDGHSEDYPNSDHIFYNKRLDSINCSNFLDVEWLSSSGNSCEDEAYERSTLIVGDESSENVVGTCDSDLSLNVKGQGQEQGDGGGEEGEYPDGFVKWVIHGGMWFP
ncbi:phosphoinositide phosphatase SAC2-like isoform X1 [Cynara cardunculus var. scolymus]|uniref:phosphoinositide phosphatase SAC2-like isoform X1 n=1 Tax=Cynara cardunculus var. scolymus TaxID=59895 RepID=UPI000D62F1F6|nr:phosphoinositide phosphatase SAC2-like isoform X1 [Cynara cardunculus var. scolymus]